MRAEGRSRSALARYATTKKNNGALPPGAPSWSRVLARSVFVLEFRSNFLRRFGSGVGLVVDIAHSLRCQVRVHLCS